MLKRFDLNDNEYELAKQFELKHLHKDINKGAIGGHISIEFVITSLGTGKTIKCSCCGETEDITDYYSW